MTPSSPPSPAASHPIPAPSPLADLHAAEDVVMLPYGGSEEGGGVAIPAVYDVPQAEYAAIRKAAGIMDNAQRGVLEITGKDRHAFLNNFLTNLTWTKPTPPSKTGTGMAPGSGVYAFLLSGKGRIVADMNVLEIPPADAAAGGDGTVYLETDQRLIPLLRSSLEKFVFTEKVAFHTRVGELSEFTLHGPAALSVLQNAGVVLSELAPLASRRVSLFGTPAVVFRDDPCGVPGYSLLVPTASAKSIWEQLNAPYRDLTNKRPLRPVGWAMFNACRIEAGRPLYGIDFTDQSLPAETGHRFLADDQGRGGAVSVTKGCYLGQEVVARMYARKQVAKQLVGLRIEGDHLPIEGAPLFPLAPPAPPGTEATDQPIGGVTSSTLSPILGNAALALATVKKPHFELGTKLRVAAEGSLRSATVVPLPFLAGT